MDIVALDTGKVLVEIQRRGPDKSVVYVHINGLTILRVLTWSTQLQVQDETKS